MGGEVHSFAVVTELGAASVAQMYVQWCLAADRPAGPGLGQRAEQYSSVGIADSRPAIGGETQLQLGLACYWRGGVVRGTRGSRGGRCVSALRWAVRQRPRQSLRGLARRPGDCALHISGCWALLVTLRRFPLVRIS